MACHGRVTPAGEPSVGTDANDGGGWVDYTPSWYEKNCTPTLDTSRRMAEMTGSSLSWRRVTR